MRAKKNLLNTHARGIFENSRNLNPLQEYAALNGLSDIILMFGSGEKDLAVDLIWLSEGLLKLSELDETLKSVQYNRLPKLIEEIDEYLGQSIKNLEHVIKEGNDLIVGTVARRALLDARELYSEMQNYATDISFLISEGVRETQRIEEGVGIHEGTAAEVDIAGTVNEHYQRLTRLIENQVSYIRDTFGIVLDSYRVYTSQKFPLLGMSEEETEFNDIMSRFKDTTKEIYLSLI